MSLKFKLYCFLVQVKHFDLRELSASFLQADNYLTPDAETQGLFVPLFINLKS